MITPNDSLAPALRVLLDTLAALPAPVADLVLPPAPDPDSLLTALGALRFGDLRVASARARAEETAASRSALLVGGIGVQRFGDPGGGFTVGPSLRAAITLPFTVGGSTRALNQAAELAVDAVGYHGTVLYRGHAVVRGEQTRVTLRYVGGRGD